MTSSHTGASRALWFLVADAVLVMTFAAIGRSAHGESVSGFLVTAWPFLAGLAVGWLITRAWRSPVGILHPGLTLWIATVVVGMLLRALMGEGTHWSFIIVASVVNAVFLLGYRALVMVVLRGRSRHSMEG